jgi:hypothetical protein
LHLRAWFLSGGIVAKQVPTIGAWYQDAVEDIIFKVVAVEDKSATIEIQLLACEIDEIDFDTWYQMVVLPAEAPEDWRSPFEVGSQGHLEVNDVYIPESGIDPLSFVESDSLSDLDDFELS